MSTDTKKKILNDWNKYWIKELGKSNSLVKDNFNDLRKTLISYSRAHGTTEKTRVNKKMDLIDAEIAIENGISPKEFARRQKIQGRNEHQILVTFLRRIKELKKVV